MAEQFRKTPRANWIDYEGGSFFITICTKDKIHFFGEIINNKMCLSSIGTIVEYELKNPQLHHPSIEVPLFVVMPNHIHLIAHIKCRDMACHVVQNPINQRTPNPALRVNPDMARHVPTLSQYVGAFKSAITREARKLNPDFAWQKRYHDHLIRNCSDGNRISEYIQNNVCRWDSDCFYE